MVCHTIIAKRGVSEGNFVCRARFPHGRHMQQDREEGNVRAKRAHETCGRAGTGLPGKIQGRTAGFRKEITKNGPDAIRTHDRPVMSRAL